MNHPQKDVPGVTSHQWSLTEEKGKCVSLKKLKVQVGYGNSRLEKLMDLASREKGQNGWSAFLASEVT